MNDIEVHKVVSYCQGTKCWETELVYDADSLDEICWGTIRKDNKPKYSQIK